MIESADAVVLPAPGAHTATVIWLHGLGADGHDFVPVVPELGLPRGHGIKFVFPHAPVRPVTLNAGMAMRAWYDIYSLGERSRQDEAGIKASTVRIHALLDAERAAGIPSERLVLAGFSQGCAMTLHAGLRYPQRLAGLVALSGYLPLHETLATEASPANRSVPILMCHGSYDPIVGLHYGTSSRDGLRADGYAIEWHEYPMQHQVCEEEIDVIGTRLKEWLA